MSILWNKIENACKYIETCSKNQSYSKVKQTCACAFYDGIMTECIAIYLCATCVTTFHHILSECNEWGFRAMMGIGRRRGNELYSLTRKNWMHWWPRWICLLLLTLLTLRLIKRWKKLRYTVVRNLESNRKKKINFTINHWRRRRRKK